MPVYEYRCRACDNTFSALVASSNTPEEDVVCPHCKERRAEKLLSMKAAIITGRGSTARADACKASAVGGFT